MSWMLTENVGVIKQKYNKLFNQYDQQFPEIK
jgi:hypothetical protein